MRIAVACDGLVVAPYFVQCSSYAFYDVERGVITDSRNMPALDRTLDKLVELLVGLQVDTFIVGKIDASAAALFEEAGIELVAGKKDDPLVAVREYLFDAFSVQDWARVVGSW